MAKPSRRIGVYPGTFDPLTKGHMGIVKRGTRLCDTVILAVAESTSKSTLFSLEERIEMAEVAFEGNPNVVVKPFSGLLVKFAKSQGAGVIIRGLRAVSDFEYEFQMNLMNRRLEGDVQTVFMMSDFQWMYLSSTIVKDVAKNGGSIRGLVPESVVPRLYAKYSLTQG